MKLIDSAFYAEAWQNTGKSSSLGSHREKKEAWQVFWDTFAPTYIKISRALIPENLKLINIWREQEILDGSSRVLDIGCGPGTFALPLAGEAKEVVGLDTSPLMLKTLQDESRALNLDNIRIEQADWHEVTCSGEFDLVLAANSPAIDSMDTLMKMNRASRRYCVYMCYAGGIRKSLRNYLWGKIMGEPIKGRTFDITYPFNILYLEGYLPHVSFHRQQYILREKTCRLFENYRAYFKIFGREGPSVDKLLEDLLEGLSREGRVEEKSSYNLAVMWWDVRERI